MSGIQEEIYNLRQKGYSKEQIKNLISQKYGESEANKAFPNQSDYQTKTLKPHHKNPWMIILLIILIGVVAFEINHYFFNNNIGAIDENIYSDDVKDWIDTINENVNEKFINISYATKGRAEYVIEQQRFIGLDGNIITLDHQGIYNGELFKSGFSDGTKTQLAINQEPNPNNGVREGFAFFRQEEADYNVYLFIDEDWKKLSSDNINIVYGKRFDDESFFTIRPFNFKLINEGLYYDKITGLEWIGDENENSAKIIVGEITKEQILTNNFSNSKFLIFI